MTAFRTFLAALFGLTAAWIVHAGEARAGDTAAGALRIEHAWARASIGNAPNSVAYLAIANKGSKADRLVGVKSDVAARVELHKVTMDNGVMRMRRVEGGIEVPAKAEVELKPGGVHVMLIGVKQKLTAGSTFDLTLQFEKQGEVPVQVKVQKTGAMGGAGAHGSHGHTR